MKSRLIIYVMFITSIMAVSASAGDFDGSKPLLCAVVKMLECPEGENCEEVAPESVQIPRFFMINLRQKLIHTTLTGGENRSSQIERVERVDGQLILQGAEEALEGVRDGLGWTIAISEETGKFILTASGDEVAFIIYGASTPQE